jgi:hypothetical protein
VEKSQLALKAKVAHGLPKIFPKGDDAYNVAVKPSNWSFQFSAEKQSRNFQSISVQLVSTIP